MGEPARMAPPKGNEITPTDQQHAEARVSNHLVFNVSTLLLTCYILTVNH